MGLLDVLFPKKCVGCQKIGEYVCASCFATISFDTRGLCLACGKPSLDGMTHPVCLKTYTIDGSFCGIVYKGMTKKLLYQFKYRPYLSGLKEFLGELLYESLIQQELYQAVLSTKPILIPIPLSQKRQKDRGYNQALLLAKEVGKRFDLPVMDILKRSKETKPQYGLKKDERRENMKNAFVLSGKGGKGTALLVDDILTTGSTLAEAAHVLKKAGFARVWGVALARDQRE